VKADAGHLPTTSAPSYGSASQLNFAAAKRGRTAAAPQRKARRWAGL